DPVPYHACLIARTFAEMSFGIQRDSLGGPVHDGFHLEELRIHVIRARLRHSRQCFRRDASPRGNANIYSLLGIGSEVFSPRVITDINLSRRIEGIHARLAVTPQD